MVIKLSFDFITQFISSTATYRLLLGKIGQEDVLHTREVKKDVRS